MNIIILAAGAGSRFLKKGFKKPKPLIIYRNKPLFWWAANSLIRNFEKSDLYFVFKEKDFHFFDLDSHVKRYFPSANIILIPELTSGPAETAQIASTGILNKSSPTIFCDCDITFTICKTNLIKQLKKSFKIIAFTFQSSNPAYSYLDKDKFGNIIGAIEKKVVSNSAISGIYLFRSINYYNEIYKETFDNNFSEEKFMSIILSKLIKSDSNNFFESELIDNLSLGTPQELLYAQSNNKLPKWFIDERN